MSTEQRNSMTQSRSDLLDDILGQLESDLIEYTNDEPKTAMNIWGYIAAYAEAMADDAVTEFGIMKKVNSDKLEWNWVVQKCSCRLGPS